MATTPQKIDQTKQTVKSLLSNESIQGRFNKLLGEKAEGFMSSILQIVNGNNLLSKADPSTVVNAAATAAILNLPINKDLGFAWIVPYKGKAQFQIGWKGLVQLAQRTGQYKCINMLEVYENQFKSYDPLREDLKADFTIEGEGKVCGYVAYFSLVSGFEKTCYWSIEKVKKHASKYSQTYNKKNKYNKLIHSPWNDEDQFDAMAKKTVLKNTLSKWGIMSIEMHTAKMADQSVQSKEGQFEYLDNDNNKTIDIEAIDEEKEELRILNHIEGSENLEELLQVRDLVSQYGLSGEYEDKFNALKAIENGSK